MQELLFPELGRDLILVIVGAGLTGLGVIIKSQIKTKESMCRVLYLYLEIRHIAHIIAELQVDRLMKLMNERLAKKLNLPSIPINQEQQIQSLINQQISRIVSSKLQTVIAAISKDYLDAVSSIANQDPILAYQLNGKQNVWEFIEIIKNYYGAAIKLVPEKEQQAIPILEQMASQVTSALLNDIDKDISLLAWKINLWTWVKCRRRVGQKADARAEQEILKEIDIALDGFIQQMHALSAQHKAAKI